ncbi:MAG TPA: transglycosylase SLT domain-containing protein [Terriglobia bacterium]|nr:transglycosylase SLT domain-containing protein [Terriglobia bacterium]
MLLAIILWLAATQSSFGSNVESAQTRVQSGDWKGAADSLDAAETADPALFDANNLHYLRGRTAENLKDWSRAGIEFEKLSPGGALRPLAAWHAARAALHLGDRPHAEALILELPADFPVDLKMELAREAPSDLALKLYGTLNSREARFQRARILEDTATLWALLRDRNSDDVALDAARLLAKSDTTPRESLDIANAFLAQRDFAAALPLFLKAAIDPMLAPEARYQRARAFFLSEDYTKALQAYSEVAESYPRTNWEKEAQYQIASCYWRMARHADAEKAYVSYIVRFGDRADDGATRNLVDVYRVSGQGPKAIALIDRKLTGRVAAATRQALLLAKAKILYSQNRFTAARDIFRLLGTMRLVSTPGGATLDEVRYFEALSQSKIGNAAAAQVIWKRLAVDPLSYFGQKAAQRLGAGKNLNSASTVCTGNSDVASKSALERFQTVTRNVRTTADPAADAVADLIFMRLWDEAFLWLDRGRRLDARMGADLAYLAGRYDRAITYADRLPESDKSAWPYMYPAAYRQFVCAESMPYAIDPLWLHAVIWQESKYDPTAKSAAAARGLLQFIPETERSVGEHIGMFPLTPERLYDPEFSIRLGAAYWADLMNEFKLPELSLAAYNGGPDNVRRWRAKLPDADVEFFVSDIGFPETKRYVQAVFGARAAYGRNN